MRVTMLGLGRLGLPCAEVMAQYHDVIGFDINRPTTDLPLASNLKAAVHNRDLIFVAVQTPHDPLYGGERPISHLPPKDFDYSYVIDLLDDLDALLTNDQLVVLISTTLPGTVRRQLAPRLSRARLVYNPYLIAMGTVKYDMVHPEMIIIGTDTSADTVILQRFYQPMMPADVRYVVGTWDEAEAIKIFYNTFISTKLALVNMIQDVADRTGHMNVDVITDALANSTKRVTGPAYMTAGLGDGGACHPRDNIALRSLAERLGLGYDLFAGMMMAREAQARNMAAAILRHGKTVVILGKAYKAGVPYIDGSCAMLVGHYVAELGGAVHYVEPWLNEYDHPEADDLVYLISHWDDWTMEFPIRPGATVFDPWRRYPKSDKVVYYGDTR